MQRKLAVTIAGAVAMLLAAFAALNSLPRNRLPESRRGAELAPTGNAMVETIATDADLRAALSDSTIILHIDVDWSQYAVQSRPVVAELTTRIEDHLDLDEVRVYRIDCTEQNGAMWDALREWLRAQHADASVMTSGYGAIVWVKRGRVVHSVHNAAEHGAGQLLMTTVKLFAPDALESRTR